MNFALGDEIEALRVLTHRWAQENVKTIAAEIDVSNDFPSHLWGEMGDLGLLGITVAEQFGGVNLGYLAHTVAVEEIARASASVSLSYGAHSNLCVNQIQIKWIRRAEEEIFTRFGFWRKNWCFSYVRSRSWI